MIEPGLLTNFKTSELVDEISRREGIKIEIAEPHQDKIVSINGPAVILVVTD